MRVIWGIVLVALVGCGRSSLEGDLAPGTTQPGASKAFAISPPTVTLPPHGAQTFTATLPASWSVGSNGGAIDAQGHYVAPARPGSYLVVARASDGSNLGATAVVTVQAPGLSLLAGTLGGNGNADGRGADARFYYPEQLAYDGAGTLYVADQSNSAIRAVDVQSGTVRTIAHGNASVLSSPFGLALDGHGHLYVSNAEAVTIDRLDLATGVAVTVAGSPHDFFHPVDGPGPQARFYITYGLAWDVGRQQLYIADDQVGVRVYDPATTMVSTLTRDFTSPVGIAFDGGTQLYVTSPGAVARIDVNLRKALPLSGYASGVADGLGTDGHTSFAGQPAIDVATQQLYIADRRLRRLDLASDWLATIDADQPLLQYPTGLALDGVGGLFVSDQQAIYREKLDGSGRTLLAGAVHGGDRGAAAWVDAVGDAARFASPGQLASDGRDGLYVTDGDNHVVRRVDLGSGAVSTFAGAPFNFDRDGVGSAGRLSAPSRVVPDGQGGYIVVETDVHTVRRVSPDGTRITTLAGDYGVSGIDNGLHARFNQPGGGCVDHGAFYLADTNNHTLRKIDLATGFVSLYAGRPETSGYVEGIGTNARFYRPTDVVCDGAGTLYVADGNGSIRTVDIASASVRTFVRSIAAQFLTRDATHLYAMGQFVDHLFSIGLADRAITSIPIPGDGYATSMTSDGAGNFYLGARFGTLFRLAADGSSVVLADAQGISGATDGPLSSATFDDYLGLLWDAGTLLVADGSASTLRRVDFGAGVVRTFASAGYGNSPRGGVGADALLSAPSALGTSGDTLYVGDWGLESIDLVSQRVSPVALATPNPVSVATGVVGDGAGHVYVAGNCVIRRYDIATRTVQNVAGAYNTPGVTDGAGGSARFDSPTGLAFAGHTIYVADRSNHTIRALDTATGQVSTVAGVAKTSGSSDGVGAAAHFNAPVALASDGQGHLFVADSGNGLVRRIDLASRAVTTVVGQAGQHGVQLGALPARLNQPTGVAVLPDGSLAISDERAVLIAR